MARNLTSIIIGISFHCPQDYSKVPRDLPWSSYLKRALSSSAPTTHCEYVSGSSPGGPLVDRRLCASMPPLSVLCRPFSRRFWHTPPLSVNCGSFISTKFSVNMCCLQQSRPLHNEWVIQCLPFLGIPGTAMSTASGHRISFSTFLTSKVIAIGSRSFFSCHFSP